MSKKHNQRSGKQKKSVFPFVTGAAIGAAAGLLFAKKTGEELREDIGDNLESIKEKALDAYDNKDEIIDNATRKIKSIAKTEIKNFVKPEYYAKDFDLSDEVDAVLDSAEDALDTFEDAAEDVLDESQDALEELTK